MNGQLSREERRNLTKAMGPVAVTAIDQVREIAFAVNTQQQVIARAHTELDARTKMEAQTLHVRVDGASAWAQKNEEAIAELKATTGTEWHATNARVFALEERQRRFDAMRVWQRLAWALFGLLPGEPAASAEVNEAIGDQHIAFPGDGL